MSVRDEYYVERVQPGYGPQGPAIVVEKEEQTRDVGCCTMLAIALFIILIVVVLIALIIFFTIGKSETAPKTTVTQEYLRSDAALYGIKTGSAADALVSPERLDTIVLRKNEKFCLFDTSNLAANSKKQYQDEHIQEARHFEIDQVVYQTSTQRRNLKHPLEFQEYARSLGIDKDCHVLLYDHDDDPLSVKTAAYVWWLFKVFGHDNVSVMNGGLKAWKTKQRAVPLVSGAAPETLARGNFVARWRPELVATYEDIVTDFDKGQYKLVDARPRSQFDGVDKNRLAQQKGRIKGAINVPASTLLQDDGKFKNALEIKKFLASQGLKDGGKPLIVYCNTGLQASVLLLATMEYTNLPVRNYDGGWVEWSAVAEDHLKVLGA